MQTLPLRLQPGQDLREALQQALHEHQMQAAFVLQGIGSLSVARLRLAGARQISETHGDTEILSLAGTLSCDGAHLHMSLADAQGQVVGGHVATGCIVRTTAEVLVVLLQGHRFSREIDQETGFEELLVTTRLF